MDGSGGDGSGACDGGSALEDANFLGALLFPQRFRNACLRQRGWTPVLLEAATWDEAVAAGPDAAAGYLRQRVRAAGLVV
eukprot:96118-Chlamydomonas_euryale.AAC.3